MSTQADVRSIDALREFRAALALFGDDVLGALGAVDMEVRRTVLWLQQDRPAYWQEQIKRRGEQVAAAKAELFRRQLMKTPEFSPSCTEQKEQLRRAEESLRDAERRAAAVRTWGRTLPQILLEYQASTRRIKDLAAGDVPRAMAVLARMIDALEAYLRVAPPSGVDRPPIGSIANAILDADESGGAAPAESVPEGGDPEASTTPAEPVSTDPSQPSA
jgi:hypothetical protein